MDQKVKSGARNDFPHHMEVKKDEKMGSLGRPLNPI